MNELAHASLAELASRLGSGATSSRDVVESCLARIATHDPRLHAFVDVWQDDARRLAEARDAERATGLVRGPLHGLPFAVKDLFDVQGRATTAGAASRRGRIAEGTATCVSRLLAAGMIPLGKTHMVELAFGTWGTNAPMGAPWNPWDLETHRVCGGSSSGSAAAVAAGMAPVALGSDTGGSVRIPAALCGLTGLKPTYGTVSLAGVVPLAASLDSIGPLAHTVDDAVLVTAAMAGADPLDPATLGVPRFDASAMLALAPDVRGMRVAVMPEGQRPPIVAADVVAACGDAARVLRDLGAIVETVPFPFDVEALGAANGRLIAVEGYAAHRSAIDDVRLVADPGVRRRMLGGKAIPASDYLAAMAERRAAMARFEQWMRGYDALLTPAVPFAAVPLADVDESVAPMATFTRAVNFLGGCALALPAGFSSEGLPIGVQLVGGPYEEVSIVAIGRAFQRATDWHRRAPRLSAEDSPRR